MEIAGSPNIFQQKLVTLMETPEYVPVYLDGLLTITKDTLEEHLSKLRRVLIKLRNANLKVNAKNSFCLE